jgi:hypothetical protein
MREAAAPPTPDGAPCRHCSACHTAIPAKPEGSGWARIGVRCGAVAGVLLLPRKRVLMHPGTAHATEVSPTEFERLGGKASYKRWRSSIRVNDASAGAWGECPPAREESARRDWRHVEAAADLPRGAKRTRAADAPTRQRPARARAPQAAAPWATG